MSELNPAQQEAVSAPLGNTLILAGAGSGKTKVLIHRIAWLLDHYQADLSEIFAVTFTNKAAGEMKNRLSAILRTNTYKMWVGTFHGLSHKLLRKHYAACNLTEDFQIIDSDDQLRLIKKIIKSLNIDEEKYEPKKAQNFINRKKDEGKRANYTINSFSEYEQNMQQIYSKYEDTCKNLGVVDFAELLLLSFDVLNSNQEILDYYHSKFKHFLIDEFQDTNTIQYKWFTLLSKNAKSNTVVGDDDQSIYGWRGAKIENIRKFQNEFYNTKIIKLEQNYRSTGNILAAGNQVISNNPDRMGKELWTESNKGELITVYSALSEEDEALFLVKQLQGLINQGVNYNEVGVLYRSNAQSRVLEEGLVRFGIPYVIYGGLRFFERAEIKDILAYLRLAQNQADNASFERVVNTPPRGIGTKTTEKIYEYAKEQDICYFAAAKKMSVENILSGKVKKSLQDFINLIEEITENKSNLDLPEIVEKIIVGSGLLYYFKDQKSERAQSRAENLEEMVTASADFMAELSNSNSLENISIVSEFLSYTALDAGDVKTDTKSVQLMTLHSAKGLEFPVVFICGMEEGLFPSHFSQFDPKGVEEERRLCYVGITRAMEKLYLLHAKRRRIYGKEEQLREQSRFLLELPDNLLDKQGFSLSVGSYNRDYPSNYGSKNSSYISDTKNIIRPKKNQQEKNSAGFYLGQQVQHTKFGIGTILDLSGEGLKMRLHIHFPAIGTKWLAQSKALVGICE